MQAQIDILENDILEKYPEVFDILLCDHTTQHNIFWATENYSELGEKYQFSSPILVESVTGFNGNIIMPRVKKNKDLQQSRAREMAEVFTPSWICNAQNNLVDDAWFGREHVFNIEINDNAKRSWEPTKEKIMFPAGKTWKHYIRDTRLEITCGEAPYLSSRYDTTTGEFIPIEKRIGLLDRKLRVINENVDESGAWLEATQTAYKNIYGFEWQGDSLLLAREALLITFIENYTFKFGKEPLLKSIQFIAYIISWNIWQMDGLKSVTPNSCRTKTIETTDLFGEIEATEKPCEGCLKNNIHNHNGTYCLIKDWKNKGQKFRFVDLIKH